MSISGFILYYLLNARIGVDIKLFPHSAETLRAQLYLTARFLARYVEHTPVAAEDIGYLQQQSRFSDARLARKQHNRAADYTAAENAVELAHARSRTHEFGNGKL